ncbi:MAG: adenylate/guanylate cyclase domain-containing protein [Rhodospirillales bacterium]|nr:adenylate/guanylate cyclase domain-containing protein [Rhodospirillales bacterium]
MIAAALSFSPAFAIRRLRLMTGIVLFSYVTTHLLNHALGIVSLAAMESGRIWFLTLWREPAIAWLLYGSLLVHFLLALWAVYQRRQIFRMPPSEAAQLLLGLALIPLLARHAIGTRLAADWFDATDNYTYVVLALWHFSPRLGALQAAALVAAWVHGCIGLYFYLRLKSWFRPAQPYLFAAAIVVPLLALLGFVAAGREVAALARNAEWLARTVNLLGFPDREAAATLFGVERTIGFTFAAALAATLLARLGRDRWNKRRGAVHITYPGGRIVEIMPGLSVLEASRMHNIPHASVCGGRGRCSTCRIRISRGLDDLPAPSAGEQAVLTRVSAAPNVRLACQLRPRADLAVAPLLPPGAGPRDARDRPSYVQGRETEIAIVFADLRGFTMLAERKLPYDLVFVLNRYFAGMGRAIEAAGGQVDKFIGDGVMALFGVEGDAPRACRQALAAAREMAAVLDELNATLTHDLDQPLRLGIGIHAGPAIVGEMGYGRAISVTAIGDAVNTASRLEALSKEFDADLVVSSGVAVAAGIDLSAFPERELTVRGRSEPLAVRVVARVRDLPADLLDRHSPGAPSFAASRP